MVSHLFFLFHHFLRVFVLSRPVSAIEAQTVLSMVVSIIVMMRPLLIYYCRSRRPSYAEADIRVKIREYTAFFLFLTLRRPRRSPSPKRPRRSPSHKPGPSRRSNSPAPGSSRRHSLSSKFITFKEKTASLMKKNNVEKVNKQKSSKIYRLYILNRINEINMNFFPEISDKGKKDFILPLG